MEFGLVLPIFLLLLFGVLYFGIYLFTQQSVQNAAQQGINAAIALDVDGAGNNLASLVQARANARVSSALAFLPGNIGTLQAGVVGSDGQCGTIAGAGFVCVSGPDGGGGYDIVVRLTPAFSSLWPGFPNLLPYLTGGNVTAGIIEAQAKGRLIALSQSNGS